MPIADGAVFAGYTIARLLGTGGMGAVYLAQHPQLPRLEALKILREDVSADPEYRQRFAREADIAASLWHPHVVAVHNRGEHEGQLWIAMDYVEGTDAAELMRDRYPRGMPPKDALEIVTAIADALDYAHERYVLHRDVKPANILITIPRMGDRRILLADFGIAKATNETTGLTATNVTVGSVLYAAPEQLTGQALDGRADQYALACTTFHLLAGEPPFVNSNPVAVIGSHLSSPPPRLGRLRADLGSVENVLAKGMAKEPFQRFDTCREFAAALQHGDAVWSRSTADTQFATNIPRPPDDGTYHGQTTRDESRTTSTSRIALLIAAGIAALLAVGLVAYLGARLAQSPSMSPTASPQPSSTPQDSLPKAPPTTQPTTGTSPPSTTPSRPPSTPAPSRPPGDLGLRTPISSPLCNGQVIAVLASVTTPGQYAEGVQDWLNKYPGASYLRTDQSCPSLRQKDDEGDPIYAVYQRVATYDELCDTIRAAGQGYGKVLDYGTKPEEMINCPR